MAEASSDMASETGRLQNSGVSTSSTRVSPGPNDGTVSSMPYGPPLTLKKTMAASGTTPSSRRRALIIFAVGAPSQGCSTQARLGRDALRLRTAVRRSGWLPARRFDECGEFFEPLVDGPRGVHGDLELAVRQPAHAPGRGGPQRDDERLALDAEGVGHREDRVDLLHRDHLKHAVRPRSRTR